MSSISSPQAAGTKRAHPSFEDSPSNQPQPDLDPVKHGVDSPPKPLTSAAATSAFRNVSACNRCRIRKNRCDQQLPACQACEKAKQRCVGFDPITRQEIPRSYVYFLESRLLHLESLLIANNIAFEPPDAFEDGAATDRIRGHIHADTPASKTDVAPTQPASPRQAKRKSAAPMNEDAKLNNIVSEIGMVSVQGASDRRYLGSTSGISFARVVLSAIKSSAPGSAFDKSSAKSNKSTPSAAASSGGSSMRDSYFGLSVKPSFKEAPFPEKELGLRLASLYFEHANPQIPILHRVEFMQLFEHAYSSAPAVRTARELYLLNIVFAIGSGVFLGSSDSETDSSDHAEGPSKRARLSNQQAQPEEYHASAIVHLSALLGSSTLGDGLDRASDDLEELQAVLLLADFALLRPVAPGLWYIVGVAMRLAVDLGLHYEDGLGLDGPAGESSHIIQRNIRNQDTQEHGRREWARDMRRRLWWCTYCFDRLVSTCVGRPFGITDVVITTEFPSLLDDKYITRTGFQAQAMPQEPSYKRVAHHYIRLRLLQSEILQVLQYQQAQQARFQGANRDNLYIHKDVPSPFLLKHSDFRSWRSNVDQRLWEWKESSPQRSETGVDFSPQFLELNYWQAVLMLYRNSLSVPEPFAGEFSPTEEVSTPTSLLMEDKDDQDLVFLKCAEAGQKTLRIYRHLHMHKLVNYTYLSTHHLFMAGISFLYALWHSPVVRSRLTIDDFDFTVLSATSVLGDLMEKCPPALACRDAFQRMSKATIQMCMNTPGYQLGPGTEVNQFNKQSNNTSTPDYMVVDSRQPHQYRSTSSMPVNKRPPPQFDMDLHELFPEDLDMGTRPSSSFVRSQRKRQSQSRYANQGRMLSSDTRQMSQGSTNILQRPRDANGIAGGPQYQGSQLSPQAASTGDSPSSYFGVNQNSYNPDFMSNVPGMEFLNQIGDGKSNMNTNTAVRNAPVENSPMSTITAMHNTTGSSPGTGYKYEELNDATLGYEDYDYGSNFNFGVGMGLDFNLNQPNGWNDGQGGFDLDGFFFGGNGS